MFSRKTLFIYLSLLALILCIHARGYALDLRKLIVFYSHTCQKCLQLNQELMPQIEKKFQGSVKVDYRDITDIENYKLLLGLKEKYSAKIENNLPVFYMEGSFLSAEGQLSNRLEWFISEALKKPPADKEKLPGVDLVLRFKNFRPLAITGAGLIDGINPCAFTVIVFFVSFLALQKYRRREIAAVGAAFIFSVFLTYILIGLGLFGFLYRIKGFWLVSRMLNLAVGLLCFILGGLALRDLFVFLKTGKTENLTLQLPDSWKERIHRILGAHYRKTKNQEGEPGAKGLPGLLVSALVTGFLVSIIEAVCTGQVYLPTLIFILKTTPLKLQAGFYILLYNIMFIAPLCVIFLLALLGVTSGQFSGFLRKHLVSIKALMAILFFCLGVSLVYSQSAAKVLPAQYSQEENLVWDFGQVKEGSISRHVFSLRNNPGNTLNIKEVSSSCGCTISKVRRRVLAPGEATSIEVSFNSKGYSAGTQQYVYVHTDSLDNPIIRFIIKANVIK